MTRWTRRSLISTVLLDVATTSVQSTKLVPTAPCLPAVLLQSPGLILGNWADVCRFSKHPELGSSASWCLFNSPWCLGLAPDGSKLPPWAWLHLYLVRWQNVQPQFEKNDPRILLMERSSLRIDKRAYQRYSVRPFAFMCAQPTTRAFVALSKGDLMTFPLLCRTCTYLVR